ncbi:MAG: hypothetical protein WBB82_11730 [Limnothrix sp.]
MTTFNSESIRKRKKYLSKTKFLSIGTSAHGTIAIGISAHGIVAIGVATHGIISIGVVAMGVISCGLVSMGAVSLGAVSMGLYSLGKQNMSLVEPHAHSTPTTIEDVENNIESPQPMLMDGESEHSH